MHHSSNLRHATIFQCEKCVKHAPYIQSNMLYKSVVTWKYYTITHQININNDLINQINHSDYPTNLGCSEKEQQHIKYLANTLIKYIA